jgi:hypothetical protein
MQTSRTRRAWSFPAFPFVAIRNIVALLLQ